ncbi:MAG TPA: YCF48-related protein [Pyrinomonadaceae bacterium]|jgi:photosystem II stability/assembly factor-like uncharacterized protein
MKSFKSHSPNLKSPASPARRPPAAACCLLLSALFFPPAAGARAAAWGRQRTGTFAWLHAVFFVDERRGWAAGGKGALLRTSDGGETWEAAGRPTTDTLRDVFFGDAETGWLVCQRPDFGPSQEGEPLSYLLKTADGGATWTRVEVTKGADANLRLTGVRFAGAAHGWAYGEMGALFATRDGGATWTRQSAPTRHLLLGANFLDERTGWLAGGGLTILKTADGGESWRAGLVLMPAEGRETRASGPGIQGRGEAARREPQGEAPPPPKSSRRLNAVWFADARRGWAVGAEGVVVATEDGGASWRPQASGVGDDLFDVKFFDAREGWAVGAGGAMLHTTDGGRTWADERRVTTHALERLAVVGRRAWAVGFGGTAVALR